jgi:glutamyl-tRNA synthetase
MAADELEVGMGKIAQPLRVALTGSAVSPSIDKTLWLTGRDRSLMRIRRALEYVLARAAAV